jgi:RNA polymerase sigma-70 factor (ECF subfamily)
MYLSAAGHDSYPEIADEALAERAAGDFEAFEELYRRYLPPIYKFVRSQVRDDATAEDITAHIFFRALASAASFRSDGSYKSWIFRIAHNSIVSWRKRSDRSKPVEEIPDHPDPDPSPALQALARDTSGRIWDRVEQLPPAQREVVTLLYGEDLTIEETARVTRRTRGAVRILLHRARRRLRHSFEREEL